MSKMKDFQIRMEELENDLSNQSLSLRSAWSTLRAAIKTNDLNDIITTRRRMLDKIGMIATELEQIIRAEHTAWATPPPHPNQQELDFSEKNDASD